MKATMLIALLLVGCIGRVGPASSLEKLQIGMTREQVIEAMGRPSSVAQMNGTEYLHYLLSTGSKTIVEPLALRTYFVELQNGVVTAYGIRD